VTVAFTPIEQAVEEIADGGMVVVVDDTGREGVGELVMAAEHVVPADVAFLVRHGSGIVCVALTGERCAALDLPLMAADDRVPRRTAFTHSVDLAIGTTTGVSAADRAATIAALADETATPACFDRPGHVFPVWARDGGVLSRAGHPEVAVDLARMAGLRPAGALCAIVDDDGSTARRGDLRRFARRHGLPMIAITDVVAHRGRSKRVVECVRLP
jgi:3,4-dihydroxy 2-butanone 4-phosphate synthase / GTP cyclohydrolase II